MAKQVSWVEKLLYVLIGLAGYAVGWYYKEPISALLSPYLPIFGN